MGGEFGTRNYTVKHLQDLKGKRVLTETMPFPTNEAQAAQEAGIDTLKVKFDPKNPSSAIAQRKAAPNTFMTFCIGFTKVATVQEAVRAGFDAMEAGADGIMCQWGPEFIRAVAQVATPVQAHAGPVPRLSTWTGGLKAVGKKIGTCTQWSKRSRLSKSEDSETLSTMSKTASSRPRAHCQAPKGLIEEFLTRIEGL